ncbi:hypothetical protein CLV43_114204 [Umezawaea tangerina]|uniref:Uncharacterized protein n=2 Tax=Umezawaea tangerina TaxID=84725 RepID=A0A2T0SPF9_9PSEU|nr:hypothetical protein CLV43_114204 [Umezawaea tangerina]
MPDRYGNPDDLDQHACNDGWIGSRDVDNPEPCLVCKPHLDPEVRRAELQRQIRGPEETPFDWSGRRPQQSSG